MNWTKASAIAEILASIAVLVTLVYLTIEVGQNTAALQTSARQATVQSDVDILLSRVQLPALGLYGYRDELSPEESVQFNSYLFAVLRLHYQNWLEYEAGALDLASLQARQGGLVGALSTPMSRRWWEHFSIPGGPYSDSFVAYVNSLLENRPVGETSDAVLAFQ